ncbi:FAS1 domain-containing protein [Powellomyces hirtus]|nr:FAS1 domain-containing protein [Powellomyces hirtus]
MQLTNIISALAVSTLAMCVSAQSPGATVVDNIKAVAANGTAKEYTLATTLRLASSVEAVVKAISVTDKNFTIFAPTDKAFADFTAANPETIVALTTNQTLLSGALFYHVIPSGAFDPKGAPAKQFVATANTHNYLQVNVEGDKVNLVYDQGNAAVIDSIASSNGIIHVIDKVMTPPRPAPVVAKEAGLTQLLSSVVSSNLTEVATDLKNGTLFAPTDKAFETVLAFAKENKLEITPTLLAGILKFHVVQGAIFSTNIAGGAKMGSLATALAGESLSYTVEGDVVKVYGAGQTALKLSPATVTKTDILVNGGVVHLIDAVLLPNITNAGNAAVVATPAGPGAQNAAGMVAVSSMTLMGALAAAMALVM